MQPTSTVQEHNDGEFNETVDVINFPTNVVDDLPPTSVATPPKEEGMPQLHSQSEAPSHNTYSSRGHFQKKSKQLHESIDQDLLSPAFLCYTFEAEHFIDSAFPFKVSDNSYIPI